MTLEEPKQLTQSVYEDPCLRWALEMCGAAWSGAGENRMETWRRERCWMKWSSETLWRRRLRECRDGWGKRFERWEWMRCQQVMGCFPAHSHSSHYHTCFRRKISQLYYFIQHIHLQYVKYRYRCMTDNIVSLILTAKNDKYLKILKSRYTWHWKWLKIFSLKKN